MGSSQLDLSDEMRADEAAPDVRVGLIGKGIQLSRTPAMHMAEGKAQGFTLAYELIDPEAMAEPEPGLPDLLARAEADGFAGVNVTYPYKRKIIDLLDELSDAARLVGAVNTVVFRAGKRYGHNTDYWGFAEGMRQGLPGAPLDAVLLLGAGGAGGAVAHALKSLGVKTLLVFDKDAGLASALAAAADGEAVTDLAEVAARVQGIVNATPMGMAKLPGTAIPAELIRSDHWVADIVYFPLETELLRVARAKGCRTLDGAGMAVFQAVRAFNLFTGRKPDSARMRATFENYTQNTQQGG